MTERVTPDETGQWRCTKCGCPHRWLQYVEPLSDGQIRKYFECRRCLKKSSVVEAERRSLRPGAFPG